MGMTVTFDIAEFRRLYDEFSDPVQYPDERLQSCFDRGTCIISPVESSCIQGECLVQALNLITAHICQIDDDVRTGKGSGIVTSASVGRVSVSHAPPPFGTSQWNWWLNTTVYGQALSALLDGLASAGCYYGGSCERMGFRKIGGIF